MRKIPKTGRRRYKHAYNLGYRAGIKKGTNGSGLPHQPALALPVLEQRPMDKLIKLLSLLKEAS